MGHQHAPHTTQATMVGWIGASDTNHSTQLKQLWLYGRIGTSTRAATTSAAIGLRHRHERPYNKRHQLEPSHSSFFFFLFLRENKERKRERKTSSQDVANVLSDIAFGKGTAPRTPSMSVRVGEGFHPDVAGELVSSPAGSDPCERCSSSPSRRTRRQRHRRRRPKEGWVFTCIISNLSAA